MRNIEKKDWKENQIYMMCTSGIFEKQRFFLKERILKGKEGEINIEI